MSHHRSGMKRSVTRKRDSLSSRAVLIVVLCLVFSADAFGREIVKTIKPANFFEFRGKVVDLGPSTQIEPPHQAFSSYKADDRGFALNLLRTSSKRKLHDLKPNAPSQEKSKTALAAVAALQKPESVVKQTLEGCALKITAMISHTQKIASRSWWSIPIFLSVIPMYTHLILDTVAMMPHWWQVVKMETTNLAVVSCFLLSNLSYFVTGGYLFKRFPMIGRRSVVQPLNPSFKWLGFWLFSSGLVSTVFHSVQALGCYKVANSLCYIDHAIAITSGLYWVHTCGLPSKKVWLLGLPALGLLGIPGLPCYEWAHSSWHLLSALAAYVWAVEGHHRRVSRV